MAGQSTTCRDYGHHTWRGVRANLSRDIVRVLDKSPLNPIPHDFKHRLSAFLTPPIMAVAMHRTAHWLMLNGWRRLASIASTINLIVHKVNIPAGSCVGPGFFLPHPPAVTFCGSGGSDLTLYSLAICCPAAGEPFLPENGPVLGDGAVLGAHAAIVGRVEVGAQTRLQFAVRLAADVPRGAIVLLRQRTTSRPAPPRDV